LIYYVGHKQKKKRAAGIACGGNTVKRIKKKVEQPQWHNATYKETGCSRSRGGLRNEATTVIEDNPGKAKWENSERLSNHDGMNARTIKQKCGISD
jgi:hypothetical protein